MSKVFRINTSKVDGVGSEQNNIHNVLAKGEVGFYNDNFGKLELVLGDGTKTHLKNKILGKGVFYGGNADSGDGYGLDTIKLIPDASLHFNNGGYGNDQYIIIDPTQPNHIHIRAGGVQDNSNAELYLGGETSHFSVGSGSTPTLYIKSNDNQWTYGTDGSLTFPDNTVQTTAFTGLSGYATETYVTNSINSLINDAPTALNTLNELSAALDNDENFATTITNALGNKADSSSPSITTPTITGATILKASSTSVADEYVVYQSLSTTTASQVLDSLSTATYTSVRYVVESYTSSHTELVEISITYRSSTVYLNDTTLISSSGSFLATYDADISGGNLRLLVTPASANTKFKIRSTAFRAI